MLFHHSQAWATWASRSEGGGAGTLASAGNGGGRGNAAAAAAAAADADIKPRPPALCLALLAEPCFFAGAAGRIVGSCRKEKAERTGTEAAEGRNKRPRRQHTCIEGSTRKKKTNRKSEFPFVSVWFLLFFHNPRFALLSPSLFVSLSQRRIL